MNIFRYIFDYFQKVRSRFRKSTRNKTTFQRIKKNTDKESIFDLAEIEEEVNVLNRKLFDIKTKKQRIDFIQIPSSSKTDEDIDRLEKIFQGLNHKNDFHSNSSYIENWNDNEIKVDNFFEEFRLIKVYRKREEKR